MTSAFTAALSDLTAIGAKRRAADQVVTFGSASGVAGQRIRLRIRGP